MCDTSNSPATFPPTRSESEPSPAPRLGNRAGTLPIPPAGGVEAAETETAATGELSANEPEPQRNRRTYRITDYDRIGVGSLRQKCRQNLAAIELLKQLEAEDRQAPARRGASSFATSAGVDCRKSSINGMSSGRKNASGLRLCSRQMNWTPPAPPPQRPLHRSRHCPRHVCRAGATRVQARTHPRTCARPRPLHRPHG